MRKGLKICFVFFILFAKAEAQNSNKTERIAINYDESKIPDYNLPNILETLDGEIVKDKISWEKDRRPEILELFENNVYGQMPKVYDGINFKVKNEVADAIYGEDYLKNGKATLKEVEISVWKENDSVTIHLTLFLPNNIEKPVPVFLLINNRGKYNTDPTRFIRSQFWPAEMIINNGYAVAAFHVSDAAPDNSENYHEGVLRLYPEQLRLANGMKAIGAWAWAASRAMDYFEENKAIDSEKVALVGHSRGGKASLWAGAQDQRFALIFSNNSGNTGAALSRRIFGETVKRINTSFPHWFADNYEKYNDKENALPIDQHMLIGLIAPRPVYVTSASRDLWADPKGTFLALKEAEPVYDLYNLSPALPANFPEGTFLRHEEINSGDISDFTAPENPERIKPIINSPIGYHIRNGKHNLTEYDWRNFIKFADFHFNKR